MDILTLDNLTKKVDESLESTYKEYQQVLEAAKKKHDLTMIKLRNLRSVLPRIVDGLAKEHLVIDTLSSFMSETDMRVNISAKSDGKFKFIKHQGFTTRGAGKNRQTLKDKAAKIKADFLAATQIIIHVNESSLEDEKDVSRNFVLIETWV